MESKRSRMSLITSTSTSDFVDLSPRRHSLYERLAFGSGDREGLEKLQMKQITLQQ